MALDSFSDMLNAARRRQWVQLIVRRMAAGLAVGCAIALAVSLVCVLGAIGHVQWWIGCAALSGWLVGLASGLASRPTLHATALAIDETAQLRDRIHSALQFCRLPAMDVYQQLQVRDATNALRRQVVSRLFPWRWPREGTWAAAGTVLALLATILVPEPDPASALPAGPPLAVQHEAAALTQELEAFEELAEDLDSDEMKELAQKLREMIEEMERDAATNEDAMVQLARMGALVEPMAAAFDPLLLQQVMQELGNGLEGLDGFDRTSAFLKEGKYEQAGRAMAQFGHDIGAGQMNVPGSGGLTQPRLTQLAAQTQQMGLAELGSALTDLRNAIVSGSRRECEDAMGRLGSLLSKYGRRLRIGRALRSQLTRLGECKNCLGGKGKGRGRKFGLPKLTFAKSNSPLQSAGTAAAMNLFDKPTDMDGNRQFEQVTGQLGSGDSEIETEASLDGEQQAIRRYRKVYTKYRKLSDAVMIEEAIPLAHRQTIKRYFELIHPDRLDPASQLRDVINVIETIEQEGQKEQSE